MFVWLGLAVKGSFSSEIILTGSHYIKLFKNLLNGLELLTRWGGGLIFLCLLTGRTAGFEICQINMNNC